MGENRSAGKFGAMNSLQVRGWPETQKVPGQDKARGQNGQLQGRPSLETDRCFQGRIKRKAPPPQ